MSIKTLEDAFDTEEMMIILETARICLTDNHLRVIMTSELDIKTDHLTNLGNKIENIMNEEDLEVS
jgi:hypothetical protein